MQNILKPQEQQLEKAEERQDGVIDDMYPSKTVHPELWENEYAITPVGTLEQRRKNIVSKMRGAGTATLQMVKDIVEAYTDGVVTPIEKNDDSLIIAEIESDTATISDAGLMEEPRHYFRGIHPPDLRYGYYVRLRFGTCGFPEFPGNPP